ALQITREREMLPIPGDARRHKAAALTSGVLFIHGTFNAPVMRHVEPAPTRIVEIPLFGAAHVTLIETPVRVKWGRDAGARELGGNTDRTQQRETETKREANRTSG